MFVTKQFQNVNIFNLKTPSSITLTNDNTSNKKMSVVFRNDQTGLFKGKR